MSVNLGLALKVKARDSSTMVKMEGPAWIHVSVQYDDIRPLVITAAVGLAYSITFMQ